MKGEPPSVQRGSALLIILAFVTLITVLVVSLLLTTRFERTASSLALGRAQAELLADYGADVAIERLREATESGMSPGKMWTSEPGRIRVFDRANLAQFSDYELFSALPGADSGIRDEKNVDLNRCDLNKNYPIASPAPGKSAATMKVGWINLLADPGSPAGTNNPITGRVAYWVDDESCKVNINTADGSHKEDLYRQLGPDEVSQSFGFGTPGEISLQALTDSSGTNITQPQASAISNYAWDTGFNSASEIGRVSSLPANFYETNKFSVTHFNKTPELTFFGEPRIYLLPVVTLGVAFDYSKVRTMLTGGIGNYYTTPVAGIDSVKASVSGPIDFIYPISNPTQSAFSQFPNTIHQFATIASYGSNNGSVSNATNLNYITRIANAINGKDSSGLNVQWPAFNGVTTGFSDKYSLRQIDSIALQIHDLSNTTVFADQYRGHSLPSIAINGIINADTTKSRSVIGLGRYVKLTEIYIQAFVTQGTIGATPVSSLQMRTDLEYYFPEFYAGMPFHPPYNGDTSGGGGSASTQFSTNNTNGGSLNFGGPNQPDMQAGAFPAATSSWFGNFWQDTLLRLLDEHNAHAGVDIMGNPRYNGFENKKDINGNDVLDPITGLPIQDLTKPLGKLDPDQNKGSTYHSYLASVSPAGYLGSVAVNGRLTPLLEISSVQELNQSAYPGTYFSRPNRYKSTQFHPMKAGVTELRFRGGLSFWNRTGTASGGWNQWEPVPLDSLSGAFTGETPAAVTSQLQQAVMPVNFEIPLTAGAGAEYFQIRVSDPLVNKFPGDWQQVVDPPVSDITMALNSDGNSSSWMYKKGGTGAIDINSFVPLANPNLLNPKYYNLRNFDGDNPGFKAANGGDPLSVWLPRQDIRYPKQSRLPSVGALNYIRTGMIPDDLAAPLNQQKGAPWRGLNFSASAATSQTVHNSKYPDWAMLDLFTVPYLPQKPYGVGSFSGAPKPAGLGTVETPLRKLTSGGATEGKLNINNPRIPFPFDQAVPGVSQTPPERTSPLEALFYGIRPSSYSNGEPLINGSPKVDPVALRTAVQSHLASNGPFLLPGQLADVPAIQAYTYDGVSADVRSRNDLLKQVVGATCTQSNVFSIWVVAQTIKKSPKNSNPGIFEPGDTITGETRRRYIIERHIDYGKDEVPGNTVNPGSDGIVGTTDDVIDANYHPKMAYPLPYKWRIAAVESISI